MLLLLHKHNMLLREVKSKKIIFAIVALILFAGIGGTISVLQSQVKFDNTFTLKKEVKEFVENFESPTNWKPCDVTPKEAQVTNREGETVKVRMSYEEYWKAEDGVTDLDLTFTEITDGSTQNYAIIHFKNLADWEYNPDDGYYYYKYDLAKGETTSSMFESVEMNCNANTISDIVTCEETPSGRICSKVPSQYNNANYHLVIHFEVSSELPAKYLVTIDPNGGTFNGSSNVYQERVAAGTEIDLSNTARPRYSLSNWTKNGTDTYTGSSIVINERTTLVANWTSAVSYTVTVDPNGGSYNGDTNPTSYTAYENDTFTLDDATREGYYVDHWETSDGTPLTGNSFVVTGDITVRPIWEKIVARIERTQKLYNSIMAAHAEAQSGDTITLLVDTAETVTNEKNVTLDLNSHTVTGSLTNTAAGNITLINGEINNPNGTAVTNNGILTMGIDDYKADTGDANILRTNIRLIGTSIGLQQNATFNFYDGFIEGDLGIYGGYDDAPKYRRTQDDIMVYYFPLVEHIGMTSRQHVELANADRAVSKTKVGGDIYYYNLQDNINSSVITGYDIYAVRDFSATYPINVPTGSTINFDLVGYEVGFQETATIDGTFNVTDSNTTTTGGTINYAGSIVPLQTIINNGTLSLTNAKILGNNANDVIVNNATVNMAKAMMAQTSGYVTQIVSGSTWNLDGDSYLYSTAGRAAIKNTTSDFSWTSGNIYGSTRGIENSGTVTISGGKVMSSATGIYGGTVIVEGNGTIDVSSSGGAYGLDRANLTVRDNGQVLVTSASGAYGVYGGSVNLEGGLIRVTGTNSGSATGANTSSMTMSGGNMEVSASNYGSAYGFSIYSYGLHSLTMTGGTMTVTTTGSGNAIGYNSWIDRSDSISMSGNAAMNISSNTGAAKGIYTASDDGYETTTVTISDNASMNVHSNSSSAIAINDGSFSSNTLTSITGGTITASSDSGTSTAINGYRNSITGGTITGGTYGISGGTTTIGVDDGRLSITTPVIIGGSYALYGGYVYFNDGLLKGDVNAYQDGSIKAIPDGTNYHVEIIDGTENCWLVAAANYLRVGNTDYNALTDAYAAVADGGTVLVIADASIVTVLPENPSGKTIYFDLNGFDLTYTQSLRNSGTMHIVDNSTNHDGTLTNVTSPVLTNNGTMTIEGGTIRNPSRAVTNNGTLTISGGKVSSDKEGIYGGTTIVEGDGIVEVTNNTSGHIYGINNSAVTVRGNGQVLVTGSGSVQLYGVYGGSVNIDGNGLIRSTVTSGSGQAVGVSTSSLNMADGNLEAISQGNGTAYGFLYYSYGVHYVTMTGGTMTVTATGSGTACGYYSTIDRNDVITLSGDAAMVISSNTGTAKGIDTRGDDGYEYTIIALSDNASISAHSTGSSAYGIDDDSYAGTTKTTMAGGSISASTDSSTAVAIAIEGYRNEISGGTVNGGTYGISGGTTTLGDNEGNLVITTPVIIGGVYAMNGGDIYFYDGILKGGTNAYTTGSIKAIPDGSTLHIETISNMENCWLVAAANYLRVGTTEYNSLTDAYAAVADGGTIVVIADASIITALPTNPSGKTIYFDLNGFDLIYTQSLANEGTMHIIDSSANRDGSLTNVTNSPLVNSGTMYVEAGTITAGETAVSNSSGTLTISGGKVIANTVGIDGGTATIEGSGILEVTNNNGRAYGVERCDLSVGDNGQMLVTGANNAQGTYNGSLTLSGNGLVHVEGVGYATVTGISSSSATISGGRLEVVSHSTGSAHGYSVYGYGLNTLTMTGGTMTVTATDSGEAIAYYSAIDRNDIVTLSNNAAIVVNSNTGPARGIETRGDDGNENTRVTVSDNASINVHSNSSTAYAINDGSYGSTTATTITGGSVTATSDSGTSIAINGYRIIVTGGTVSGGTYGINGGTTTLGADDGAISIVTPVVIGGSYALHDSNISFYDGILKGAVNAVDNVDNIRAIASGQTIFVGSETIGSVEYETHYLIAEYDVARIGSTNYTRLSDAIADASNGDTIYLIADNYIFYRLTIPAGKDITIETDGYNIITGNQITNNGDVKIINSNTGSTPQFIFRGSAYYLTNTANSSLELENMSLKSANIISNSSSLSIKNSTLDSTNIAIDSTGSLILDGTTVTSTRNAIQSTGSLIIRNQSSITGSDYAVYVTGGTVDIDDSTLIGSNAYYQRDVMNTTIDGATIVGGISNIDGSIIADDCDISYTATNRKNYINNTGTFTLTNSQIAYQDNDIIHYNDNDKVQFIISTGTLSMDDVTMSATLTGTAGDFTYGLYNTGSSLTLNNTTISVSSNQTVNESRDGYGLYNTSGTVTMTDSVISSDRMTRNYVLYNVSGTIDIHNSKLTATSGNGNYGIYNDSGTVTIGEPEPSTSPDYGQATANVSLTMPEIRAIGTTDGYGVYFNTGRFNYYDGKIIANTWTMNNNPTNSEHIWEPCTYTDTSTTPTTLYTILKWMRNGQSGCGN